MSEAGEVWKKCKVLEQQAKLQEMKRCMRVLKEKGTAGYAKDLNDRRAERWAKVRARVQVERDAFDQGRKECLELCAAMGKLFPRELRDLIYKDLIGPGSLFIVRPIPPETQIYAHRHFNKDIWWRVTYMGDEIGSEISERWYQIREFLFHPAGEDGSLRRFLSVHHFDPTRAFLPAQSVRKLILDISHTDIQRQLLPLRDHFALLNSKVVITFRLLPIGSASFIDLINHKIRPAISVVRINEVRNVTVELRIAGNERQCTIYSRYPKNAMENAHKSNAEFDLDDFCDKLLLDWRSTETSPRERTTTDTGCMYPGGGHW